MVRSGRSRTGRDVNVYHVLSGGAAILLRIGTGETISSLALAGNRSGLHNEERSVWLAATGSCQFVDQSDISLDLGIEFTAVHISQDAVFKLPGNWPG